MSPDVKAWLLTFSAAGAAFATVMLLEHYVVKPHAEALTAEKK